MAGSDKKRPARPPHTANLGTDETPRFLGAVTERERAKKALAAICPAQTPRQLWRTTLFTFNHLKIIT